jgi:cytochrome c oxidase subunit II
MGPDLTHLAGRRTIGAGILANTRGNLSGWIANPQAAKPGVRMPATPLSGDELNALVAYLETLQ